MDEYISRKAVFQVVHGIARGIATKDTEALKAKDMKTLYKIKGAKEILNSVDTDLCYIPSADVQPVDRWISVKDRLPDKDGNYLCYLECGDVCQSAFDSTIASDREEFPFGEWVGVYDSETLGFKDSYWEEHDAITHWMPLPEPPKGGDTE